MTPAYGTITVHMAAVTVGMASMHDGKGRDTHEDTEGRPGESASQPQAWVCVCIFPDLTLLNAVRGPVCILILREALLHG